MPKYQSRRNPTRVVTAEQFIGSGPCAFTPAGMTLWPDEQGFQPRDGSFGYCDSVTGRVHVQWGDWIIPYDAGAVSVVMSTAGLDTYFTRVDSKPSADTPLSALLRAARALSPCLWLSTDPPASPLPNTSPADQLRHQADVISHRDRIICEFREAIAACPQKAL